MSQTALAKSVAIEQPTMAATLARMERDGLIQRRPDPDDGRSTLVSLAPAAEKKVKAIEKAVGKVNQRALSGLSEREKLAFVTSLETIVRALSGGEQ